MSYFIARLKIHILTTHCSINFLKRLIPKVLKIADQVFHSRSFLLYIRILNKLHSFSAGPSLIIFGSFGRIISTLHLLLSYTALFVIRPSTHTCLGVKRQQIAETRLKVATIGHSIVGLIGQPLVLVFVFGLIVSLLRCFLKFLKIEESIKNF